MLAAGTCRARTKSSVGRSELGVRRHRLARELALQVIDQAAAQQRLPHGECGELGHPRTPRPQAPQARTAGLVLQWAVGALQAPARGAFIRASGSELCGSSAAWKRKLSAQVPRRAGASLRRYKTAGLPHLSDLSSTNYHHDTHPQLVVLVAPKRQRSHAFRPAPLGARLGQFFFLSASPPPHLLILYRLFTLHSPLWTPLTVAAFDGLGVSPFAKIPSCFVCLLVSTLVAFQSVVDSPVGVAFHP
ncbi:uncharacterized protein BDZ99DRAFT_525534 [Mytilinidion resinicola]|uniref:Uncharacterized protein n=1 Tax=Mytilinidion resinicola TaxID=574789 RepID=A0A6A6Y7X2_9PEZI|nr:uncharacterized protein BDZ99DRAFT_525534 [Mytilinidion resinicola]KAF2804709.1 hypothetical protein BDZ99DRAFT_525534 [Mytilinidion resinicola]